MLNRVLFGGGKRKLTEIFISQPCATGALQGNSELGVVYYPLDGYKHGTYTGYARALKGSSIVDQKSISLEISESTTNLRGGAAKFTGVSISSVTLIVNLADETQQGLYQYLGNRDAVDSLEVYLSLKQ